MLREEGWGKGEESGGDGDNDDDDDDDDALELSVWQTARCAACRACANRANSSRARCTDADCIAVVIEDVEDAATRLR